ncbi:MAG: hypothetical protein Q8P73_03605 [bacterium]|nr:hypothetical protein [bacterium]MDZ4346533.1 hypothetical protein [Candidatus Binatia bacterium]
MNHSHKSQGDISVYIALMMLLIIASSVIILNGILSRQIKLTQDIVASERAYYAANSGLEEIFYRAAKQFNTDIAVDSTLVYTNINGDTSEAAYNGQASVNLPAGTICADEIVGSYANAKRRLNINSPECGE